MRLKLILAIGILTLSSMSYAQKVSISTNVLGYAALGTMNADISYAFTRHWSVEAGVRYNPFTFRAGDPDRQFQYRQQSYSLGARLWPWHIWSGWWFSSGVRYQEYNSGGIFGPDTREGDRIGAGVCAGYTHMVSRHFNVEFGAGVWGGIDIYKMYSCPVCGMKVDSGRKGFFLPDDIKISLVYVF